MLLTIAFRLAVTMALLASAGRVCGQEPKITWEPFALRTYDGREHQVEIGRLAVPERRGIAGGATTHLGFYRLKSVAAQPASPTVFLMGGPGIAASLIAPIPPFWALFDTLRTVGDVILLDQRGLGLSTPNVDCPAPKDPPHPTLFSSRAAFIAEYRRIVAGCAAHFRSQGIDPLGFSDAAIADDLEDLRRALGSERISLLGFSYGTRLAMTYARRHPARVDRLALQGPTDDQLMYRSSRWYDSLLVRLAGLALGDTTTAGFAGNLVTRMRDLFARVEAAPLRVRIASVRGDSLTVTVGREVLQGLISGRLTDPRIPALIQTLEQDDPSVLRLWLESTYNDLAKGAGSLMARAVVCSQRPGPARVNAVDREAGESMFGPAFDNFALADEFCAALGKPTGQPIPHLTGPLDRPALIVVGSLDDRTPLSNAIALSHELGNPIVLTVEGGGHDLLPARAVRLVVLDFLAGRPVADRKLRVDVPRFLSIEEARRPPRRPGG